MAQELRLPTNHFCVSTPEPAAEEGKIDYRCLFANEIQDILTS